MPRRRDLMLCLFHAVLQSEGIAVDDALNDGIDRLHLGLEVFVRSGTL